MILKKSNKFELKLDSFFYPHNIVEETIKEFSGVCKIDKAQKGKNLSLCLHTSDENVVLEFLNYLFTLAHIRKIYSGKQQNMKKPQKNIVAKDSKPAKKLGFSYLPFLYKKIKNKYLITTKVGSWIILNQNELGELFNMNIKKDTPLFKKLLANDIIVNRENIGRIIKNYRNLNLNLFQGPSLHIISLTSSCNQKCVYCHASANDKKIMLDKKTAIKFLESIFQTNSNAITIEFQGGETLLNWDMLKLIIEQANHLNRIEKKNLRMTLVSNLSLINEQQMDYLLEKNISLCTSLDGPKHVHDANRKFLDNIGTYDTLIKKIKLIRAKLKKAGKSQELLQALPTITKNSLKYHKEIIDEYINQGFTTIHLRFLNYLGYAKKNWPQIGYSAEEFNTFWRQSLDYILKLNKKGVNIKERGLMIMLMKLFRKIDPMYTELMSPCGAGRTQLLYAENGDVFTCDEARTLNEDLFRLGNILKDNFAQIMRNNIIKIVCESSLMELYNPTSVFSHWQGTCPVVNYSESNSIIPKIYGSMRQKILDDQFSYIFEKMIEDEKNIKKFKNLTALDI